MRPEAKCIVIFLTAEGSQTRGLSWRGSGSEVQKELCRILSTPKRGKRSAAQASPIFVGLRSFSRSLALRSWFLRLSSDVSWWLFEAGAIGLVACAAGESSPHFSTYSGTAMQLVTLSTLLPSLNLIGVRQTSTVFWTVHGSIRSRRLWGRYCITCRCRSC